MKNIDAKTVVTLKDQVCMPSWPGHQQDSCAKRCRQRYPLWFWRRRRDCKPSRRWRCICHHSWGSRKHHHRWRRLQPWNWSVHCDATWPSTCTSGSRRVQDAASCCVSAEIIYLFAKRFCRYFLFGQVDSASAWSNAISALTNSISAWSNTSFFWPNTLCNYNTHRITEWVY